MNEDKPYLWNVLNDAVDMAEAFGAEFTFDGSELQVSELRRICAKATGQPWTSIPADVKGMIDARIEEFVVDRWGVR